MTTREDAVLYCSELAKSYAQGGETVSVLKTVNFAVERGEKVAITGASGSGKTTLLNILGGLDDPTSGEVFVCGRDLSLLNESERAKWRNRQLGFVYQFHHLLAEFSAVENVAMPLLIANVPTREARARAEHILAQVGLDHRHSHRPSALSGGERQRVAIARALVTNPACVLMDEPTGNLDPGTADNVLNLLLKLNETLGISFVVVTHDHQVAGRMDRTLALENGEILTGSQSRERAVV